MLSSLRHDEELGMHVVAALRNGLTLEQIQEILMHVGMYAGVPIANRAFAVAEQALRKAGAIPSSPATEGPERQSEDPQ